MRLVHTADVHLDAPHRSLGDRGADLRRRTWEAWERTIDAAIEREVELFVIAGDLFDTRNPARETIDRAFRGIERLANAARPIEVALLPGTHDCWSSATLWDAPRVRSLPDRVHLLAGPEATTVHLPHLDAAVHGCAHRCDVRGQRPLCGLRADPDVAVNIGVAHGSLDRGDVEDSALFGAAEIEATGMDYVALGHWHTWQDVSIGEVTAVIPGSIEVSGFGDWPVGSVALVTLGEGPPQVERMEVGTLRACALRLDVGDLSGTEDMIAQIEERADPHLLLEVRLTGLAPPGVMLDVEAAVERMSGAFFALRIADGSHPALDELDAEHLDGRLTLGRFAELARERIEGAGDERERRVAERALQIGVSMLRRSGGER
ncbi:MAG: metallophosphoesterase family protein [Armatimonadota bacterium]|jgi:exonuclease SbcD